MTNQDVINFLNQVRKILLNDKSWLESTIQPINEAFDKAISALQAQQWIPCNPSELPRDKGLWVTHDNGEYRYIDTVYWDMTEWTDNVSDVVAYMPYIAPEPYQEDE